MPDEIDLRGIENKLDQIAGNLDKPFEDIHNDRRHAELLRTQNRHHKEILKMQYDYNRRFIREQKDLIKWTRVLAVATIGLCIFTLFVALGTKQSVDMQANLYSPRITAQITDTSLPWSHYAAEYEHRVPERYWSRVAYNMPIYVEINNDGIVPFQLHNIEFKSNCGHGNSGLLSFPSDISKVIGVGETLNFTDKKYSTFNTTVLDGLPCETNFVIYGNNLIMNKKITLIRDSN
jgi:hypothetical protein